MRRKNSYTEFGQWLRIELIKRNITAKELAEMAGLDHRVVSDVMIGRNKSHQQELKQALQKYDERTA
ncbi:MAG: hypothetical protein NC123_18935 [Butyrivibrio sp.]|nr:hypothetical protein [Acetatifactor muris]MCM1561588.1 hypothetical protein [Butyrivibrio sp.]